MTKNNVDRSLGILEGHPSRLQKPHPAAPQRPLPGCPFIACPPVQPTTTTTSAVDHTTMLNTRRSRSTLQATRQSTRVTHERTKRKEMPTTECEHSCSDTQAMHRPPTPPSRPLRSNKSSLAFIMNHETDAPPSPPATPLHSHSHSHSHSPRSTPVDIIQLPNGFVVIAPAASWSPQDLLSTLRRPPARTANRAATAEEKRRRTRTCTVDGCHNFIINRGLCFRHGGGRKCSVADCAASAKSRGLCWRHGGSAECTVEGCERRSKSRGLCWTHGGGTRCSDASCAKVAVSNGFCWAHGGGKRCAYNDCRRAAYERNHNYCDLHYRQLRDGGATMELCRR